VGIRDQLDDAACGIEEIEAGGTAVGLDDGGALLDVRVAVELENLVPPAEPRRGFLDLPGGMLIAKW